MEIEMTEPKIAYVTKYALTSGIKAYEIANYDRDGATTIKGPFPNGWDLVWKSDWAPTPEAALARAEEMRVAKIASLKKQIAKLEKLRFEVETKEGAE